ncbi:hypothetical protein GCM10007416_20980 [Kroppenstedtia guangzhouensis]|uniref:Uncharacterized protein n=1 Tax=Kroppenstedtia guangzhouensis TaxID=1274356 RepID=A0ABQ1GPJ5_9BACL|nr:hypothetical protein GCM10007416_20980 [Kroppenstedtia guangzhouensis]
MTWGKRTSPDNDSPPAEKVDFYTITLWIGQGTNTKEELFIESKTKLSHKTFSRLRIDKNPVDNQPGSLIQMGEIDPLTLSPPDARGYPIRHVATSPDPTFF